MVDNIPAASLDALHDLSVVRYMSAAGLVVLLYDHILTFADEVELIWPAPATYAKYMFLLNRYGVLGTLLATAYAMCGFVHTTFTDQEFIFTCSMVSIISIGIANLLILQRVVILWEHRPIVLKIMTAGFFLSFTAQVVCMIVTLLDLLPVISWSDVAGMCIATRSSHIFVVVWAAPLVFEAFVLGSTALNALDRPTTTDRPIIKALHSDGLSFFLAITSLRVTNLVLASLSRPSFTFLGVFFIWAATTTVLARLLLRLRRTEVSPPPYLAPSSDPNTSEDPDSAASPDSPTWSWDPRRRSRALSPFGLAPLLRPLSSGSSHSSSAPAPSSPLDGGAKHQRAHSDGAWRLEWAPPQLALAPVVEEGPEAPAPAYVYHYRRRQHDPTVHPWDV
ncbi:uncharacterized protein BXZ73DRAFT_105389 [Epithele typhae]|uniref:uncharacterized protein n=1 Tax=Epithele typhae TaxID=378194 RepID=UPI002007A87D|nr:uncharacterized protein BXZ73DRAFT_105389 [Epithele typhae]KAH9917866.1 hypothetical protein BXZ73DRAFT_105389 [Epithele typhae]